jgi:hypothetical protein
MMIPLDYGRSFLIGKWSENEVRFWAESRTRIVDEQTGVAEDYIQAAACKSEDTFAERNLFYEDNYNFTPVFGPEYGVIFRRKAWLNPNYKSYSKAADMFGGQTYWLVEAKQYQELPTPEAVIQATHAFKPVVAQTEIRDAASKLCAIIEYPVKTLNTHKLRKMYQTDTGPVVFPDLTRDCERHVERLDLAYVAFNVPHFADFVIEAPTPLLDKGAEGKEIARIYHYSRRLSLPAKNRLFALQDK